MTIPVKHPLGGPGTLSNRSYESFVIEFPPTQKVIFAGGASCGGRPRHREQLFGIQRQTQIFCPNVTSQIGLVPSGPPLVFLSVGLTDRPVKRLPFHRNERAISKHPPSTGRPPRLASPAPPAG